MSEGATYSATTFGAVKDKLETTPVAEPLQVSIDTPAIPSIDAQPSIQIDNQGAAPVVTPTPEPEVGVTSYSLGDDQPPADAQPATPAAPQFNFDDEIKKVPKKELLKKVGVSDFALELDEHIANGGNPLDYLNARAINYDDVTDEALLKDDLRKQYPTLTPSQIELMYNRRYIAPIEADDEDKQFLDIQKVADASKVRTAKKEEQQKFKVPEANIPVKDEAYEQWKQYKESQTGIAEKIGNFYANHEATKKLHESKRVAISVGDGIPPFNINIDKPEMVTRSFTDNGESWRKVTSTQSGEPDVQKQQLIYLFANNPERFIKDIFNYGKQLGVKGLVEEGQNAQRPQAIVTPIDANQKPTYKTGTYGGAAK